MGQYYRGAILDLNEFRKEKIEVVKAFCCYKHNNGAKLMEHSYVTNWYVKEYEKALATEFFGMPFVWVGDYADEKFNEDVYGHACRYIESKEMENAKNEGFYKVGSRYEKLGDCGGIITRDSGDFSEVTEYKKLEDYKFIVNLDKNMFVQIPEDAKDESKLIIHPLPLLCASGNGRGGGDYYGVDENLVGSWAYDRIGVTNKVPDGMEELIVKFKEEW